MAEKANKAETPEQPLSFWNPSSRMFRRHNQQWLGSLPDDATYSWARKMTTEDVDTIVDDGYILVPKPHQKPKKTITESVMDTTKSKGLQKKEKTDANEENQGHIEDQAKGKEKGDSSS